MMRSLRNGLISAALAGAGFAVLTLTPLPALAEGPVVVRDFVLSHAIDQREPVDATDFFHVEDGKAVAFARIRNTGAPTSVSFVWYYGETNHAIVTMDVGRSPGWRTWSTVNLRPGDWRVELVDAEGGLLTEKAFHVGLHPAGPPATMEHGLRGDMERPFDDTIRPGQLPALVDYPMR